MRKLVLGLVLCVGIVLGLGSRGIQPNARAAGGGALATKNGDINGDGTIDLTDAVGILFFLFQDGAPPVAIAESPELLARISALEEKANLIGMLEQKLAALEGVPAGLSDLQGRVGSLEQELQRLPSSGEIVFFAWNAAGVPQRAEAPFSCGVQPHLLNFPLDEPRYGRAYVLGGAFDGTSITFATQRRGHLFINMRGFSTGPRFWLWPTVDDQPSPSPYLVGGLDSGSFQSLREVSFLGPEVPPGTHILKIFACPSETSNEFESRGGLNSATITVQQLPPTN